MKQEGIDESRSTGRRAILQDLRVEVALWPPVAHLFGCFGDGYSVRGLTGTNSPSCRFI